jgi:pyridoxine 5-phosphate synthase
VRRLSVALDGLVALREFGGAGDVDLPAACTLAELAGADAIRLGVTDELRPVTGRDVQDVRRVARVFELRMPATQALVKAALEARPDRVVLAEVGWDGRSAGAPLDLRGGAPGSPGAHLATSLRALEEAGIPTSLLIPPDLEAVKAAHALGADGIELFTGTIADLPAPERRVELDRLSDAHRLAAKLRMEIGVGGGLGLRTAREVAEAVPALERVAVGRGLLARACLVGLDRAIRDLRALLG